MKKFITIILALCLAWVSANAQIDSRGFGFRGLYGFEVSYQHYYYNPHFMEVDLGLDMVGDNGFKATGTYNWVVSNPMFGYWGEWLVYMGPGVSVGYVYDSKSTHDYDTPGFMMAFVAQFGIEFRPWQHFGISVDMRPMFGYHFRTNGFYRAGMNGFIPSLGFRYLF